VIEVPYLEQFRSRHLAQRNDSGRGVDDPDAWIRDNILIRGLGLGLHQTLAFLYNEAPSLETFEAWILERNEGTIEPERIARINAALDGTIAELGESEPLEPVFDADDLAFWDANGYVVLHDAAPPERLRDAERAIWAFLDMDAETPATWYGGAHSIWVPLLQHPALWANRRSPRIRSAFAQLWGRNDLWVTVDQAGMNPPETAAWKFPGPDLHFDVSLVAPVPFGVSGILYLTDTAEDQGAFTCVPGFHKRIDAWLDAMPAGTDPRAFDLKRLDAKHIAGSAGDLIVWHQALPHGSSPNRAKRPRLVQYIAMSPSTWDEARAWK
jgi:hypothetical protein